MRVASNVRLVVFSVVVVTTPIATTILFLLRGTSSAEAWVIPVNLRSVTLYFGTQKHYGITQKCTVENIAALFFPNNAKGSIPQVDCYLRMVPSQGPPNIRLESPWLSSVPTNYFLLDGIFLQLWSNRNHQLVRNCIELH